MGINDVERGPDTTTNEKHALQRSGSDDIPETEVPALRYDNTATKQEGGLFARLRHVETLMDRKLGIESEAIDRKTAQDKKPPSWTEELNMALLWASGTMNLSCFATGFLGHEFGLSLRQSIIVSIFGSLLGGAVTGFCATFGAPTGLRQISVGRFAFGWWPNRVLAALNTIQQIGWSSVGCITGGLALQAVADSGISIAVGVVIIAIVSLLVSFFGLRVILIYERYAWFIFFIIFLIIFGMTGKYTDNVTPASGDHLTVAGNVLSLLAIVYGSSASWATIASDYYVQYPVDTSRTKVLLLTTLGVSMPTAIGMTAGCVVSFALNNRADWAASYDQGIGYVVQDIIHPHGFGKFILVLLVLSGIGTNILATYSAAISCQQFAPPFARVPRFVWTVLCFAAVLVLAIVGSNHLNEYLEDFLSLLGYWCTSYAVILFIEHYLFRGASFENYDLEGWDDPARLPLGIGASIAFSLGVVAWCMGMVETWYVGPLGKLIGAYGGDVANEFTFVVTIASYIPARYLELKYVGR